MLFILVRFFPVLYWLFFFFPGLAVCVHWRNCFFRHARKRFLGHGVACSDTYIHRVPASVITLHDATRFGLRVGDTCIYVMKNAKKNKNCRQPAGRQWPCKAACASRRTSDGIGRDRAQTSIIPPSTVQPFILQLARRNHIYSHLCVGARSADAGSATFDKRRSSN